MRGGCGEGRRDGNTEMWSDCVAVKDGLWENESSGDNEEA